MRGNIEAKERFYTTKLAITYLRSSCEKALLLSSRLRTPLLMLEHVQLAPSTALLAASATVVAVRFAPAMAATQPVLTVGDLVTTSTLPFKAAFAIASAALLAAAELPRPRQTSSAAAPATAKAASTVDLSSFTVTATPGSGR